MSDEVGTIAQRLGNVARIDFEVFSIGWRAFTKSAAIQDAQCPAIGQRVLSPPCRCAARDAPVHEQGLRSIPTLVDVQMGHSSFYLTPVAQA